MNPVGSPAIIGQGRKEEKKDVVVKSYQEISKIILINGQEAVKKAEAAHNQRPSFLKNTPAGAQ